MKSIKKIILIVLLTSCTLACEDILEKTDLTGVDERVWDNESTANLFLNRIYDLAMPVYYNMRSSTTIPTGLHTISDEANTGDVKPLYGTVGIDNVTDFFGNNTNNAWFSIRRINILLTEIDKGMLSEEVKNKLKGQAYFLRAWLYFNLVKLYGGVPLIDKPQDWVSGEAYVPRNKTSECFDFIINDLDASINLLQAGMPATQGTGEKGRITKDIALAIKGRVLLYWASAQFNPQNDVSRWQLAYNANKAAYDSLTAHGYRLFSSFQNVLIEEGASNKEVIMIRSYDGSNKASTFENVARPVSESAGGGGAFHPTWEMVKAFPMKDGRPSMVNGVPANGFDSVYYWRDRDPRFYATIAYNGSVWELSSKTGRKQWNYANVAEDKSKQTATGFYCRKGINTKILKDQAANGTTDWVEMRFAEVMLNLAESASAIGNTAEAYTMLTAIRARAGITPGDGLYGLQSGMNQNAMFNAIIEERRIELAFEGKRYDDLRRTRLFHTLNGKRRHALIINVKAPYTAAQLETKDAFGIMLRDKLNLEGTDYTTYFAPAFVNLDAGTNIINFSQNYYFYPIPTTNLQRNTSLLQTKGWETGEAFDPLE